ncbi:hypothetical protein AB0G83_22325 [Streptomyces klenkii]|uniref:hypothetical protein n=1 Tax=Streptomyces klenkii TaxID=1420899 RepID=UPI0033D6B57F
MAPTLPVPIEFSLPEGWLAADPEAGGGVGVAFAAVHPQPDAGFTANITIHGENWPDTATLVDLADESVKSLRDFAESVVVADRREVGSMDAPALVQRLAFSAVADGKRRDLVQSQVYLSMLDVADPHRRAVVRMALTASASQHDTVLGDFQDFVRTVRPSAGTEV